MTKKPAASRSAGVPKGANQEPAMNRQGKSAMGLNETGGNTKGVPALPKASLRDARGVKNFV